MPTHSLSTNIFAFLSILSVHSLLLFTTCCSAIDEQGQALLTWKNTLNASSSSSATVLQSWNPSDPNPCKWYGIYCNSNGHVEKISLKSVDLRGPLPSNLQSFKFLNTLVLSSTNLTGTIPNEFGDYLELVLIDISDNSISGEIPLELCRLSKLQSLFLNTNALQGPIPYEIGNLSNLRNLILFDNQLSGEIPKSIGGLTLLESFRAGGNQNLKGELPREIGNCTSLVVLGLAETSVSGALPPSIGMLKNLQTLAVYTSLLSGPIPDEIGNCTELQNIYLYQNSITGSIPRTMGELKKLQSLLLWQNSIVGTVPLELGSCGELRTIDLSENQLTGSIPTSFGNLIYLEELQLSVNQLSGTIPSEISNCTSLTHFEVDNNLLSGEIPPDFGRLKNLTLLFAWKNNLTGNIPLSLSECDSLQALDLSYNELYGSVPKEIFSLRNLTKLLVISNQLTGFIPPDIGNCTNLYRFRISDNQLGGTIPNEIGKLKSLNFLDMGSNRFVGNIPGSISGCESLEFLDLHSNSLTGSLPDVLPRALQFVDISGNMITGSLPPSIGSLTRLTKLDLGNNRLSGDIPPQIGSCQNLQMLDLGNNGFSGNIPRELARLSSLEISLNLSCNRFTGEIPGEFSSLDKLGVLDLSHNEFSGTLDALKSLENLVSLNVSFNDFSGEMPNTPFFHKLPLSSLAGNKDLYVSNGVVTPADATGPTGHARSSMKLAMSILVSISAILVLLAVYMLVRSRMVRYAHSSSWEVTLYQKMEFSIDEVVRDLTSSNVIGTGSSGVVYKVTVPSGEALAVKKMWSGEESGAFSSEIRTLGSIRHKNIIRLLGYGSNQTLKLLFYDYLPNGSLSSLLHGAGKGGTEWETRYDVVLGIAHALAYLHHDCVPPIMHGDVKAMNVLLGPNMEPYLADFGLARIVDGGDERIDASKHSQRPHLAGSYGYMAPEHASMLRITEKSDVYSFGMVLLEVLTGRHPLDPSLPGGAHLVQWVRAHLQEKRDPIEVLDPRLRGRADPQVHEMFQTLAVAFLCLSTRAEDRPMMKDVVAMLKEIRPDEPIRPEDTDLILEKKRAKSPINVPSNAQGSSTSCSFAFSDDSIL